MLQALVAHGVIPDMVVGCSVGALNGAYFAGTPTLEGVKKLAEIWRGLRRRDVFPVSLHTLIGFLWRGDFLISHDGVRKLIDDNLPFKNLDQARLPIHIVTTDIVSGDSVVLSDGSAAEAIVASTSIPGAFEPVQYRGLYLADGAISSNTPIRAAIDKGATRLIILPTGYACAGSVPPVGAVANALHALTLLIARQMTDELDDLEAGISYAVVPPLCPLVGSPYDFSRSSAHIAQAIANTEKWIVRGGLERGGIPDEMRPHAH
ncbi:MAG: patatin-like phospholipase family protein [Xanthobacteraceae bacterium]|nr:patatin-like phospholipase family protein [Xanthobacteraceae bacterium]